jgi:hypothetical protein
MLENNQKNTDNSFDSLDKELLGPQDRVSPEIKGN